MDYRIVIYPLPQDEGGGYAAYVPDLPGCMSDGDTPEQALHNVRQAMTEWLDWCAAEGHDAPQPGSAARQVNERRATFLKELDALHARTEQVDERIAEIERNLRHLIEQGEHSEAERRFSALWLEPGAIDAPVALKSGKRLS